MFRTISLKFKLASAFLVVASLVGLVSYLNFQTVSKVRTSFGGIVDLDAPRLRTLEEVRFLAAEIKTHTIATSGTLSTAQREQETNHLRTDLDSISAFAAAYAQTIGSDKDETQAFKKEADAIIVAKDKMVGYAYELVALHEDNASQAAVIAKQAQLVVAQDDLETQLTTAIENEATSIEQEGVAAKLQVAELTRRSVIISVLSGLLALLLGLSVAIAIARNVQKLKEGAAHVANGNFNHQVVLASHDELGQLATSFNDMSTRLKGSYQRLALESKRDETILESMGDGLIAVDDKGSIVLINDQATTILRLGERSTLLGKIITQTFGLFNLQDTQLTAQDHPAWKAYTSLRPVSDVFAYHAGEKKILVNISATPIVLNGRAAGVVMVIRDVTKEREIDRMKTEFISLASHQLRTPLSAIRWFTEMLISGDAGKLTPEQDEFAKNIYDSADRMIQLVNSLLNISRIESGRIIVDPKPTDLQQLVTGVVNDLKAKTAERQQNLVVSVHRDLPKVNLDPRLIGQVYMNFLTNAIKYTPKGGEISVFVSRKGDELVSQITDNGYGIPKEQHNRVFQKFFRAENIVKVETDGTGLGLYLVKAIIESSGGRVWFESEPGKGTTFWFTIPMSGMKAKAGEVTLDA